MIIAKTLFFQVEVMVVSLFCTPENGILIQDSFTLHEEYNCLLGIEVPYYYFVKKVSLLSLQQCNLELLSKTFCVLLPAPFENIEATEKVTLTPSFIYTHFNTLKKKY